MASSGKDSRGTSPTKVAFGRRNVSELSFLLSRAIKFSTQARRRGVRRNRGGARRRRRCHLVCLLLWQNASETRRDETRPSRKRSRKRSRSRSRRRSRASDGPPQARKQSDMDENNKVSPSRAAAMFVLSARDVAEERKSPFATCRRHEVGLEGASVTFGFGFGL